jgi:hypothetical protein
MSNLDMKRAQETVILVGTVEVISHLVSLAVTKGQMFPQQWVNGTLATLAGFGLHDLLGKHIEGLFKGMKKGALKQGLLSFVRVATMLIVKRIIMQGSVDSLTNKKFQMSVLIAAGGYALFNVFVKDKLNKEHNKSSVLGPFMMHTISILIADLIPDQDIEPGTPLAILGIFVGIVAYEYLIKGKLLKK